MTYEDLILEEKCDCCKGEGYCYNCSEPSVRGKTRCEKCNATGQMPTALGYHILAFIETHGGYVKYG